MPVILLYSATLTFNRQADWCGCSAKLYSKKQVNLPLSRGGVCQMTRLPSQHPRLNSTAAYRTRPEEVAVSCVCAGNCRPKLLSHSPVRSLLLRWLWLLLLLPPLHPREPIGQGLPVRSKLPAARVCSVSEASAWNVLVFLVNIN